MSTYKLPHFEELNVAKLEERYETELNYHGRIIELDLNFEEKSIDINRLKKVEKLLSNFAQLDAKALKAISENYHSDDDTIKEYIDYHFEQLNKEAIEKLIKHANKTLSIEEQFVYALNLIRVGFYPENVESFATFDYTVDRRLSDYLVVVQFNENGTINHITTES